jgi:hypothetical protein
VNTSTDPGRPRRVFLIGLMPLAVGVPASLVANHMMDATVEGVILLITILVESLWMLYLSSK